MEAEKQVVAEQFVLCDAQGEPRAILGTGDNGQPGLSLYDPGGQLRVMLSVPGPGAGLCFFAPDPAAEPVLVSRENGSIAVRFPEPNREPSLRIMLSVLHDGSPNLVFRDAEGVDRLMVSADARGMELFLRDTKGRLRAVLGVGTDSTLMLHDAANQARVHLSASEDGTARLLLMEADGKFAVNLVTRKEG